MSKILVIDHKFNVESIASCSKIDPSITFYGLNNKFSFYDNLDIINPDAIWINNFFANKNIENLVLKDKNLKIKQYMVEYILPNVFAQDLINNEKIISALIYKNIFLDISKVYQYDNMYVRFYSLSDFKINHTQYCGKVECCRDLTTIISSSSRILTDSDLPKFMCGFYNKEYGVFKNRGTISWQIPKSELTNKDIFFQNVN